MISTDALTAFFDQLATQGEQFRFRLPSRPDAGRFIDQLLRLLFPITQDCQSVSVDVQRTYDKLTDQLQCLLRPLHSQLPQSPEFISNQFFCAVAGHLFDAAIGCQSHCGE